MVHLTTIATEVKLFAFKNSCELFGGDNCDPANPLDNPDTAINTAADLATRISRIFTLSYALIATIFVGVVLYGVWKITTAGGSAEQKAEGFKILRNGIFGFFGSFVVVIIAFFVFLQLGLFDIGTFSEAIFNSGATVE